MDVTIYKRGRCRRSGPEVINLKAPTATVQHHQQLQVEVQHKTG
jgi:hypothetical protein